MGLPQDWEQIDDKEAIWQEINAAWVAQWQAAHPQDDQQQERRAGASHSRSGGLT